MSEYVPTTEEVREAYTRSVLISSPEMRRDRMAQFDRWLAVHDREAVPDKEKSMSDEYGGIEDTSAGRCNAALNLGGEHFQCDYSTAHDGWAHNSRAAQAIWKGQESTA